MKYTVEELANAKTTSPEVRDMLLALEKDSKRYRFFRNLRTLRGDNLQQVFNAMDDAMDAVRGQVTDPCNMSEDQADAIIDAGIAALDAFMGRHAK